MGKRTRSNGLRSLASGDQSLQDQVGARFRAIRRGQDGRTAQIRQQICRIRVRESIWF